WRWSVVAAAAAAVGGGAEVRDEGGGNVEKVGYGGRGDDVDGVDVMAMT
ncbi:hypothetical protein Tco_1495603, partial [Tanacetum coccineum]